MPRWAFRMPLGLLVEPDEKNNAAASLGRTAAAVASTSSRGSSRPRSRNAFQESMPSSDTASPTIARWRKNGYLADCSAPGAAVRISGSSSASVTAKSFARTALSNKSTETPESRSRWSSSAGVENVLSVTTTAPAIEVPKTAATHSGRFVINTPTRPSLPKPHTRRARATSIARSHSSAYVQRVTPSGVRSTSASRGPYFVVTSRRKPGKVSGPSPGSSLSGGPETIEVIASLRGSSTTAARPRLCSPPARRRPGW